MEKEYLDQLPEPIRQMVFEIEALTQREVVVRQRVFGDTEISSAPELPVLDCYMNEGEMFVTITYRSTGIKAHMLAHEVMHAWLKIVRKTPFIKELNSDDVGASNIAALVSNDIEHMVIVATEISLFAEASSYWTELYTFLIRQLTHETHAGKIRGDLFRHLLVVRYALDDPLHLIKISDLLEKHNLVDEAQNLIDSVDRAGMDVGKLMLSAAHFLLWNPNRYGLMCFDVQSGCCQIYRLDSPELAHTLRTLGLN